MAKNPFGKSIPIAKAKTDAYAVYTDPRTPGWTWYVLKMYQTPEAAVKNPYARAFTLVTSPMTGESGDLGDTYLKDIGYTLVSGVDVKRGKSA